MGVVSVVSAMSAGLLGAQLRRGERESAFSLLPWVRRERMKFSNHHKEKNGETRSPRRSAARRTAARRPPDRAAAGRCGGPVQHAVLETGEGDGGERHHPRLHRPGGPREGG